MVRCVLLVLVFALVCPLTAAEDGEMYSPRVGEAHADFVLPSISDGSPVSLSQFAGQKVLLIHFASW